MTFRSILFSISAIVISSACKTIPKEPSQEAAAAPAPVRQEPEETPAIKPSAALKGTSDLVTPGPDEVINRRGPGARCPTAVEMDALERTVASLGRETIDLVKEDLVNLRQTSSRTDRDGITSCCNQMEQLVQDAEIMNEDKDAAVSALDRIRKMTLLLCPAAP